MFVFVLPRKLINPGAFGSVVSVSCLESETSPGSLCISMITGITTAPPIKVLVPLLGHYLMTAELEIVFFFFVVVWDEYVIQRKST